MRKIIILGIAAAGFGLLAADGAQAARWCYSGPATEGCVALRTKAACLRFARREGGTCHVRRAAPVEHYPPEARYPGMRPGQIYPNRPYWANPNECFTDEGGGRFRPCSAGGGGGRR